jgi:hypothetical protein
MPDAIQMLIDQDGDVKGIAVNHRLTLTDPQDLITSIKGIFPKTARCRALMPKKLGPIQK